jgi:hypothetical protein
MTTKTASVSLGRARLPNALATQFMGLPPNLRARVVGFIVMAHVGGMDLQKLVAAIDQLRRLGVLLNQSLRVSRGVSVDVVALQEAAKKVNQLFP